MEDLTADDLTQAAMLVALAVVLMNCQYVGDTYLTTSIVFLV